MRDFKTYVVGLCNNWEKLSSLVKADNVFYMDKRERLLKKRRR